MDIITKDLLKSGDIKQSHIDRLEKEGIESKLILKYINLLGFISTDILINFVCKKLLDGNYSLELLEKYDYISKKLIFEKLASELDIFYADLDAIDINYNLSNKIPLEQLKKHNVFPIFEDELSITFAFSNPLDMVSQDAIQRLLQKKSLKVAVASKQQILTYLFKLELKDSIKDLVKKIKEELNSTASLEDDRSASSILLLIDVILRVCVQKRASDIHIEPTEKNCTVRARIDGKLVEVFIFEKLIYPPLASRLKLLSNLDIAEKRKPQDGRFSASVEAVEYDFRISTLPIFYGESIVMRILDKQKALVKLEKAGMDSLSYKKLIKGLSSPYGIILVTGPTGSGKTTTLYGALSELRNTEDKIITIEDPIEYKMNLIQQVQVNKKVGLGFSDALRSILRQDPDKIMVGEIRDKETLEIAVKAALTGHLVLSTLHTNNAISSISRMVDMGIASYLLSGALVVIQAQRLVRKICPCCKTRDNISLNTIDELREYIPTDTKFYKGAGCKECNDSGFMGREMICEILTITNSISSLIAKNATREDIQKKAIQEGFVSILENGIQKAIDGITTIEEVLQVAK